MTRSLLADAFEHSGRRPGPPGPGGVERLGPTTRSARGDRDRSAVSYHVLVVDDDPTIASTVRDGLEFEGYRVTTAVNGADALARIVADPPSLILLDMRMPVMNGWEFAERYRRTGHRAPIVVMTAAPNAQAWADEIQANAVLAKPFTLHDLLTTVERLRVDLSESH